MQKLLYLSCEANLFRNPKITFRDPNWGREHWRPQIFFQGGKHRHFAQIFQIADDAMQMEVNKTLYPFYAPKIMPRVRGRWKGGWEDQGPGY